MQVKKDEVEVLGSTTQGVAGSNGAVGRGSCMGYSPVFHSSSTPALINDTIQRAMGYLSDYGKDSGAREMEADVLDMLVDALEFEHHSSGYGGEHFETTDDLGPAGNLLKLIVRHGVEEKGRKRACTIVKIVHKLSGSKSPLSRKVGVR